MQPVAFHHRVEWGETDAAGIVFYPNYYRWFDQATHALFRTLGYSLPEMMRDGHATPLIEAQARFLAPLRYDDEIVIESRVTEVRTRAFRLEHRVQRAQEPVADGYEVRAWVRYPPGEHGLTLEAVPPGVRRLLGF